MELKTLRTALQFCTNAKMTWHCGLTSYAKAMRSKVEHLSCVAAVVWLQIISRQAEQGDQSRAVRVEIKAADLNTPDTLLSLVSVHAKPYTASALVDLPIAHKYWQDNRCTGRNLRGRHKTMR